VTAIFWSTVQ